jgi:hypothetical protein
MTQLDVFGQIEKAVVAQINKIIADNPEPISEFAANRNNERASDIPSVNVAVTGGEFDKVTMMKGAMDLTIEVLVVSTNPREETDRRDDLYPMIFAIVIMLAGVQLSDENGQELPIDIILPAGKWGQTSKTGEQLAYVVNFKTTLNFAYFREENAQEIRGFLLDYYKQENKVAADKIELETEEKKG